MLDNKIKPGCVLVRNCIQLIKFNTIFGFSKTSKRHQFKKLTNMQNMIFYLFLKKKKKNEIQKNQNQKNNLNAPSQ